MSWKALNEAKGFLLPLLILCGAFLFLESYFASLFFMLCFIGVALFFRDPSRRIPSDPLAIVSPADGLVDCVEKLDYIDALKGPGIRISIFLSVFDVHINRMPYAGRIIEIEHQSGAFLDARRLESAFKNENQLWIVETVQGRIGVRQIAGLIARRIIGWCELNQQVATGQRLGLIRFGSRTDLYLPLNATPQVQIGQHVYGGSCIIARWN